MRIPKVLIVGCLLLTGMAQGQDPLKIKATTDLRSVGPPYLPLTNCIANALSPRAFRVKQRGVAAKPTGGDSGGGFMGDNKLEDFGVVIAEPDGSLTTESGTHTIQPGELVVIKGPSGIISFADIAQVTTNGKSHVNVSLRSVLKHQITRGKGAFSHQSPEHLNATIRFPDSTFECSSFEAFWRDNFEAVSQQELAKYLASNPTGILRKELREGMTPAEVEAMFGLPEKQAKIGDKLTYFYSDMKVVFQGGRLVDVK